MTRDDSECFGMTGMTRDYQGRVGMTGDDWDDLG